MCYVLLAATAPRAVTSMSCEVVRYSRATRGDENARAGRGEDARGGESPGGRVLAPRARRRCGSIRHGCCRSGACGGWSRPRRSRLRRSPGSTCTTCTPIIADAGPATVGARPDGEAEDENELHGLALCVEIKVKSGDLGGMGTRPCCDAAASPANGDAPARRPGSAAARSAICAATQRDDDASMAWRSTKLMRVTVK